MTTEQREMRIKSILMELEMFEEKDLNRLLGFIQGMKSGISKRENRQRLELELNKG